MERNGHDIIVIGASAGGVEALSTVVRALPGDLAAAVFVVVHFPSYATSVLPDILARRGKLPVRHAVDGEPIEQGRVYVAPPDRHLLLGADGIRLARGPRENGHRPAVDPLFRSAAQAFGGRVIGVVLSGNLDDGTAGLAAVKRRRGLAVVQDPDTADYPGMPSSAAAHVEVDHVVPLEEVAELLVRLVDVPAPQEEPVTDRRMEFENAVSAMDPAAMDANERPGTPSGYSCPECHGVLWELDDSDVLRFRCRVGHAFGAETLMAEQGGHVEEALWTALLALRERAALSSRMATKMTERGNRISAGRFAEQAGDADRRARVIEEVLASVDMNPMRRDGNGGGNGNDGVGGPDALPGEVMEA